MADDPLHLNKLLITIINQDVQKSIECMELFTVEYQSLIQRIQLNQRKPSIANEQFILFTLLKLQGCVELKEFEEIKNSGSISQILQGIRTILTNTTQIEGDEEFCMLFWKRFVNISNLAIVSSFIKPWYNSVNYAFMMGSGDVIPKLSYLFDFLSKRTNNVIVHSIFPEFMEYKVFSIQLLDPCIFNFDAASDLIKQFLSLESVQNEYPISESDFTSVTCLISYFTFYEKEEDSSWFTQRWVSSNQRFKLFKEEPSMYSYILGLFSKSIVQQGNFASIQLIYQELSLCQPVSNFTLNQILRHFEPYPEQHMALLLSLLFQVHRTDENLWKLLTVHIPQIAEHFFSLLAVICSPLFSQLITVYKSNTKKR